MTKCFVIVLAVLCVAAQAALAVKPGEWKFSTEAEFQEAEVDHTVVTNLGNVELSRAVAEVAALEGDGAIVYDLARGADGVVWAAVGPTGKLVRLVEGELQTVAEYTGAQVFALSATDAGLWVGVSGATSKLERRDAAGGVVQTVELPEVRYVWDIAEFDGRLVVATGTDGKVLLIDPSDEAAEPVVALDSEQPNVLCLVANDVVYAGTDGEGLVYRLTRQDDEGAPFRSFIVYDASEPEVGALLLGKDGNLYVGTADADQARPGRLSEVVEEETGTPDDPQPQPEEAAEEAPPVEPEEKAKGPTEPDVPAEADTPTPEQYDELREEIKKRIAAAAKGKQLKAKSGGKRTSKSARRAGGGGGKSRGGGKGEGNAVYAIDPQGFVREVFRESVMVLRLVEHRGMLYIATGNEGQVYRVDPATDEVTVVADLESQQVPAMLVLNGNAMIGTANPAQLHTLDAGFAERGTYTSDPLDAQQASLWGKLNVHAELPAGTTLAVQTRSGNAADPEAGSWSAWSDESGVELQGEGQPVYLDVASPPARYLQYRLVLGSEGDATPSVSRVALKYVMPNMKPTIASIKAEYAEPKNKDKGPQPKTTVNVEWEAADPNGDELAFTLEARRLGDGSPYVELDAEIEGNSYEWDTRSMPDGRYELRLVASDSPDNVPDQAKVSRRITAQVVIDNAAPQITNLSVSPGPAQGTVKLVAEGVDALSQITDIRYAINGSQDWQPLNAADLIYDSTSEGVSATIRDLSPGRTVVTVRFTDALGNTSYESATVQVAE